MPRAVFFDLDGTLLDTVPDICRSLNETLTLFGYAAVTEAAARRFVGDGALRLIERAAPEGAPAERMLQDFRARYAACGNAHTRRYAGAKACLAALKAHGSALAVITNKPHEAAQKTVVQFFPEVFDFVGGDSGMFACKPDPSYTRYAALTLRVPLAECFFVGDGETDARTAHAAGMRFIAALWGYRSQEELAAAGAREFAADFHELERRLLP